MTDELLAELTEKLLTAYRNSLEAQRAYYGRAEEVDETLKHTYLLTSQAFERAKFLHLQALTLWSPHSDPRDEYTRFARKVAKDEGWTR